jgi:hypothetical protein
MNDCRLMKVRLNIIWNRRPGVLLRKRGVLVKYDDPVVVKIQFMVSNHHTAQCNNPENHELWKNACLTCIQRECNIRSEEYHQRNEYLSNDPSGRNATISAGTESCS